MKSDTNTLQTRSTNSNEPFQQINEQFAMESTSTHNSESQENELSPLVVTLGDERTRIARKYAADVFADVVAILGLERISKIYPNMVSTEERFQYGYNARKRRNYWVCFHGANIEKKARLETLGKKLGVDLDVKINHREDLL